MGIIWNRFRSSQAMHSLNSHAEDFFSRRWASRVFPIASITSSGDAGRKSIINPILKANRYSTREERCAETADPAPAEGEHAYLLRNRGERQALRTSRRKHYLYTRYPGG